MRNLALYDHPSRQNWVQPLAMLDLDGRAQARIKTKSSSYEKLSQT